MVYKWHFSCQLGDGLCYRSHLLGEPETTIDWLGKKMSTKNPRWRALIWRGSGVGGSTVYSVSHSKLLGFCGLIKRCVVVVRVFLGVQITQTSPNKNQLKLFLTQKKKHDRPQNNVGVGRQKNPLQIIHAAASSSRSNWTKP